MTFHFVLVGATTAYLPHFVVVLRELETSGIGQGRSEGLRHFELVGIESLTPDDKAIPLYDRARETFFNDPSLWKSNDFESYAAQFSAHHVTVYFLHHLIRALLWLVCELTRFYCSQPLWVNFQAIMTQAEKISKTVCFLASGSNRSGGFLGKASFLGELALFLPLLLAGEVLHAPRHRQVLQADRVFASPGNCVPPIRGEIFP